MTNYTQWKSLVDLHEYSAIPDSGIARYNFEDDSDTTTAIDSWNGNNGTINGATYTTTSAVDSLALSFSSGDTVDLPTLISDITTEMSISMWVRADSFNSDFENLLNIQDGTSSSVQIQTMSDGRIRFMVYDGDFTDVYTPSVSSNTFVHVVGVFKPQNQIEIYLNGNLEDTTAIGPRERNPVDSWELGDTGGRIKDDVKVFSKALTNTEVSNLYNADSISG